MKIEKANKKITIIRQCELLGIPAPTYYYKKRKTKDRADSELKLLIDKQYIKTPFYGTRRMTYCLKQLGFKVNRKRVQRLMREMGLQAIYPKKNLSKACPGHKKYPYLLKTLQVTNPNQVWCTDITYIPMTKGNIYLTVVMDWYSRYILSYEISITMDKSFCIEALSTALKKNKPEIFNSDQGSQFTSIAYTDILKDNNIKISMDGRGRAFDNIFIERLWRSLKYEEVYLREYNTVKEAKEGIEKWVTFYNTERPHSSLEDQTPEYIYFNNQKKSPEEEKVA